jgi:hypothetical protein
MSSVDDYSWCHCIDLSDGTQISGQKIILPTQQPRCWQRRKHPIAGSQEPKDAKVGIARAIYTATRSDATDDHLDKHWYGRHSLNSVHDDSIAFLEKHQFSGLGPSE